MQVLIVASILATASGAVAASGNCTAGVGELSNNSTCNTTAHPDSIPFGLGLNKTFASFLGACFLLIVVVAVICNAMLILTILSVKRLHSVTHVFIINLAVGDVITAVVTIPFDIDFMWRGYFAHSTFLCGVMHVSFLLSLPSSVINLCLLTVDRFISIQWPFRKMRWLGRRNIVIALVVSWTYTFLVALFPIISNPSSVVVVHGYCLIWPLPVSYAIFMLVVNFLIPIIIIVTMNVLLFIIANNHSKQIRQLTRTGAESSESSARSKRSRRGSMSFGANMKAAKRLLLLVGVFIVCWLCYIILVVTNLSCNECHAREVTWMGNVVNYSSVAINPVLYGLLNKAVRKEMIRKVRQLVEKCLRKDLGTLSSRHSVQDKTATYNVSTQNVKPGKDDIGEMSSML